MVPDEAYQKWLLRDAADFFRSDSARIGRSGDFYATCLTHDSLDSMPKALQAGWEVADKYTPPILSPHHSAWILAYQFCHFAHCEVDHTCEKDEETRIAMAKVAKETYEVETERGIPGYMTGAAPLHKVGPFYANTHLIAAKIKKALDPNNVANTTRFIDISKIDMSEAK